MTNLPQSRQTNIVVQEFENEILIYDLKSDKAYCLNETSAMVWQLCDGEHSVVQISQKLSKKLNNPMTEDVVWLALDSFKKNNLLKDCNDVEINFNGLNRRQVIKKIGFASMIALPVIASVIAPTSAMAASTGALLGQACGAGCNTGLSCRNFSTGGSACCVPGGPSTQTYGPGTPICGTDCPSTTSAVCCSGSGTSAPPTSFCSNQGFVTCTCNLYP